MALIRTRSPSTSWCVSSTRLASTSNAAISAQHMEAVVRDTFAEIDPSGRMAEECWSDYAVKLEAGMTLGSASKPSWLTGGASASASKPAHLP